jgi:cytochrome c553
MKILSIRFVLPTALLTIVFASVGQAGSQKKGASGMGPVQAKAVYCKDCHGISGQGYHGFLVMPRLAGQTPEYIENQLRAFAERTREKNLFINMARVHGLSAEMQTALAEYFSNLETRPVRGVAKRGSDTGKRIYDDGIPETNIPACAACHGPQAEGEGQNPRLAGQLYAYTVKELANWDKERRSETAAIMSPIARVLSQAQITAIAAYVSSLK